MSPAALRHRSTVWLLLALPLFACDEAPTQPLTAPSGPSYSAEKKVKWFNHTKGFGFIEMGAERITVESNLFVADNGVARGEIAIRSSSDDQLLRIEGGAIQCTDGAVAGLVISGVRLSDGAPFRGEVVPADGLIVPPEPIQPIEECLIFDIGGPGIPSEELLRVEVEGLLTVSPDLCAITR